jgi:hypothetical protein
MIFHADLQKVNLEKLPWYFFFPLFVFFLKSSQRELAEPTLVSLSLQIFATFFEVSCRDTFVLDQF